MIFDSIDKLYLYEKSFPSLKTVKNILENKNLMEMEPGSYTTDDPLCRYNICQYNTSEESKDFEIHKKEADVQIMLEGYEIMTAPFRDLAKNAGPYDEEKDIHFVGGPHAVSYVAKPGTFAIFLPGEPHAPGLAIESSQPARKVVFKLSIL